MSKLSIISRLSILSKLLIVSIRPNKFFALVKVFTKGNIRVDK